MGEGMEGKEKVRRERWGRGGGLSRFTSTARGAWRLLSGEGQEL